MNSRFSADLGNEKISFASTPGIAQWNSISPAVHLLAQEARLAPQSQALILGCGHGALGAWAAKQIPQGRVLLTDINFAALQAAQETLRLNQVHNALVQSEMEAWQVGKDEVQAVLLEIPKSRKLARRWLVHVEQILAPGGELFIAGANSEGIHSILHDAESLYGNCQVLAYQKGNRVGRVLKCPEPHSPRPTWASEPGIAPQSWLSFEIHLPAATLFIRSLPGIFSCDQLDEGTQFLLENVSLPPGARVLDFGCGYGVIGLYYSKTGAAAVDLLDINLLAVQAAQENIQCNALHNVRALPGNLLAAAAGQQYSHIISNPPFHSGHKVEYDSTQAMIQQAHTVLQPGGELILVANQFIRYEHTLRQSFHNVRIIAGNNKYRILSGSKTL